MSVTVLCYAIYILRVICSNTCDILTHTSMGSES